MLRRNNYSEIREIKFKNCFGLNVCFWSGKDYLDNKNKKIIVVLFESFSHVDLKKIYTILVIYRPIVFEL